MQSLPIKLVISMNSYQILHKLDLKNKSENFSKSHIKDNLVNIETRLWIITLRFFFFFFSWGLIGHIFLNGWDGMDLPGGLPGIELWTGRCTFFNIFFTYTIWEGLMIKSMCFLFRGQRFKTKGVEYVCFCRLSSQIIAWRWVPCPTNKGVSYTNLVYGLVVTLKLDNNNNSILRFIIFILWFIFLWFNIEN